MRKIFISAIFMMVLGMSYAQQIHAVREGGANGAFSTITDAYEAANSGDIIVVQPKSGDRAYVESITIDKGITLTTETEGVNFVMDGSISIDPISDTVILSHITLIGTSNFIQSTGDGLSTNLRTIVRVMNCNTGNISISHDNYDLTTVRSDMGTLTFKSGKIVANTISKILVSDESSPSTKSREINEIVANKITGAEARGIDINSDDYFFSIRNNYIVADQYMILVNAWLNSNAYSNEIINNSIDMYSYNSTSYCFYMTDMPASASLNVYSNLIDDYSSSYTTYVLYEMNALGSTGFQYNIAEDDVSSMYRRNGSSQALGTNIETTSNVTFDANAYSAVGADMGHTDVSYSDIDLTRNDAGCYGGSDTMANYWPTDPSKPIVFSVKIPSRVLVGETFQVEAAAIDN